MANSFGSFCDGLFLELCVTTQLELPSSRETILAFFERLQRLHPEMNNFSRRDGGEYVLEQESQGQRIQWVGLEADRITAGCADPDSLEQAYALHAQVLELIPYMLGVSPLDIDSLDITFGLDFDYQGNHDEVIAAALLNTSSFGTLFEMPQVRAISCCPSVIIALSDDCRLQARVAIESRTTAYDVRSEKYKSDEPISLYFSVRRYPLSSPPFDTLASFREQCRIAENLMFDKIIPHFVQPLNNAIAQRR
ncbi:MAG TPA: hypothetical protein PK052_10370 [Anaerohalosphaeraceae bacterium]|nr:hypothetical protein [Anaerohalosphaeraceae bacterium]HOM76778.1 hypothetical protein [Anaerohalosphaeraceae bacterium]HPC65122.1 hypothetical protein [Anaerohalosphaeraceae bacterium]HPO70434.1 hypothetical protein [Anaerohalosphaeraceae bacterium]HRS72320.1 hypothetical protein [Anaerohalosphaeraceae bacterium]